MGLKDHYVASLKGSIYRELPDAVIVDVSHEVRPFRVSEAAFHLSNCYRDFPEGTVHVVGVDSVPVINFGPGNGSFPLIMKHAGQYFISNDNGFFGVFLQDKEHEGIWQIDNIMSKLNAFQFPAKRMLVPAACRILRGENLADFATPVETYRKALSLTAVLEPNLIKGNIVHFDSYGNAITNIHKSLFERYEKDAPFVIHFRREDYKIDEICNSYNEVPEGERVAIFNENGLLEIAINRGANNSSGGAEKLFGLKLDEVIRVEFMPRGSKTTIESLF